jgi:hypothetical protein
VKDVALSVKLADGWRASGAQVPSRRSPIVLVTLEHSGKSAKHVRLDLDKKMLIDQPPAEVSEQALAKILAHVNAALERN